MSKKKTIYVWTESEEFECTRAERVGTAREFDRARREAAIAADELREKGNNADVQTVYNAVSACYSAMPDGMTELTESNLYYARRYIEKCIRESNAIYWPFVLNRLLDFLECEYYSKDCEVYINAT